VAGADDRDEAGAHARALKRVIVSRQRTGEPPLVFGVTYPFSSHNYEFRFWMANAGIDPDRDVTLTIVPPPFTADALKAGAIDGFCVNAPWNVSAVEAGIGRIVAVKADIWTRSPEKVLGTRPDWWEANRDTGDRLIRALASAARWCDALENRGELAEILARPEHVGGHPDIIGRILSGALPVDPDGTRRLIPGYLAFHAGGVANLPSKAEALWVYSQMIRWGQVRFSAQGAEHAGRAFRPDLLAAALGGPDAPPPPPSPPTGDFDPARIEAYVRSFVLRRQAPDEAPSADD
jgi:two-component system, oxyanion-binding sensor